MHVYHAALFMTLAISYCLTDLSSAKGPQCGKCFDVSLKVLLLNVKTKNCDKVSTSRCATANHKCMEFEGTAGLKISVWPISLYPSAGIKTRYCKITSQTGCQKTDLTNPSIDPTNIVSKVIQVIHAIPMMSYAFKIKTLSGKVCVSSVTHMRTGLTANATHMRTGLTANATHMRPGLTAKILISFITIFSLYNKY
ncbi:uncharacterized protein LOC134714219 [Mytilus trossulus]|uniref:uncharacterized protein LOC134714219 n=1 Tax=Mytilus trossulus TaxID=6551 RepID=UPI0030067CE0